MLPQAPQKKRGLWLTQNSPLFAQLDCNSLGIAKRRAQKAAVDPVRSFSGQNKALDSNPGGWSWFNRQLRLVDS